MSQARLPAWEPIQLPERVLVMGLGVHGGGLGVARWLLAQGVDVTVTDMANGDALSRSLALLQKTMEDGVPGQLSYVLGEHRAEDFMSHAMVVVNPAVRPDSPWLVLARQAGARIESEMSLFFRMCPGPILGITGTKGKTTTARLTGAILQQRFAETVVAGNLRVSALENLERITPATPVVLELSSFQLMGLGEAGVSPPFACITNFSPDHLNYHGTMAAYAQAKRQIFLHQSGGDVVVLPHDEAAFWLSGDQEGRPHDAISPRVKTFSLEAGDGADCFVNEQGAVVCDGEALFRTQDVLLQGRHNLANVLAATALARSFQVEQAHIRAAVESFQGVEHRLEMVCTLHGVRYVNDTTATNPTAARAALLSFEQPVILIAGGADKGLEFGAFPQEIVRRCKALILLDGKATERLQQEVCEALQAEGRAEETGRFLSGPFDSLEEAVATARGMAEPGDVVLLSPGCASFGLFRNEFHRGKEFRRIVATLPIG